MYLCLDCEKVFEEPVSWTERHHLDFPPYEVRTGCPRCGGAYVKTIPCDQCRKRVTGEYIELKDGTIICEHCYEIKNVE